MCGYASGSASKWRTALLIFNAQVLFTIVLCCCKRASDLLYKTSLCKCTHASTISSQNMTQCPSKHEKWSISSSCSSHSLQYKSTLRSSKGLVYIVFRLIYGSPTSRKDLASFWGQIPLHMAKKSPKRPNLGKNYNIKNHSDIKIKLSP
jgi:hypothetical protein